MKQKLANEGINRQFNGSGWKMSKFQFQKWTKQSQGNISVNQIDPAGIYRPHQQQQENIQGWAKVGLQL